MSLQQGVSRAAGAAPAPASGAARAGAAPASGVDPRLVTRGSDYTLVHNCPIPHGEPAFDWYQATIEEDPDTVTAHLQTILRCGAKLEPASLRYGWSHQAELRRDDRRVALVLGGGQPGAHVIASGGGSQAVAEVIRQLWPAHHVSRADVAFDFLGGPPAWDLAASYLRQLVFRKGLKQRMEHDPDRAELGRTLYVGSTTSETRSRLYEKGLKDYRDTPVLCQLNRWEVQVRPQHKDRKSIAARLEPRSLACFSTWSSTVVAELFGDEVVTLPPRAERRGDDERALITMFNQYKNVLGRAAERMPDATLADFLDHLRELAGASHIKNS